MSKQTDTKIVFRKNESGLFLPEGTESRSLETSQNTYLEIKDHALKIQQFFAEHGVSLPSNSGLSRLIASAKMLSDQWLQNRSNKIDWSLLFKAGSLRRVANAILPLCQIKNPDHYLKKLRKGNLLTILDGLPIDHQNLIQEFKRQLTT